MADTLPTHWHTCYQENGKGQVGEEAEKLGHAGGNGNGAAAVGNSGAVLPQAPPDPATPLPVKTVTLHIHTHPRS